MIEVYGMLPKQPGIMCSFNMLMMTFEPGQGMQAYQYAQNHGGLVWTWLKRGKDARALSTEKMELGILSGDNVLGYVVLPRDEIEIDTDKDEEDGLCQTDDC